MFIADTSNHRIRRVNAAGAIETIAGNGIQGFAGDDGPATNASLSLPSALATDASGALYIADTGNQRIRRIRPDGVIETLAGNGIRGFSGDGGPALQASLARPLGLAVDPAGNLFIADTLNNRIRQLTPDGMIDTLAGDGFPRFFGDGGPPAQASLAGPVGLALDASNALYIADGGNDRVRRVSPDRTLIQTFAGIGVRGFAGDGGPAAVAALAGPISLAFDASGNLFIADRQNLRVRQVDPNGVISTIAGNGMPGFSGDGGPATQASIAFPIGLALDDAGNLLVLDAGNLIVRRVSAGIIETVAGNRQFALSGDGGPTTNAAFASPIGVAADLAGNLFVVDAISQRIRRLGVEGTIQTVAGNGMVGPSDDGGPATQASLAAAQNVAVDAAGNLYIADTFNNRIRQVTPDGIIQTFAGNGQRGFSGDAGPATEASLTLPEDMAVGPNGDLIIADSFNHRIRVVGADNIIRTVAGNGVPGFSGDGGPAVQASLDAPLSVAVDPTGAIYIADRNNHRIRMVAPNGAIETIAGNGQFDFSGDGGPATDAALARPESVALDAAGNLFIVDRANNRVRQVSPDGIIQTVAGNGFAGFSGDGGPAAQASLFDPAGLAVDAFGNILIADQANRRVRAVLANPPQFPELPIAQMELSAPSAGRPVRTESLLITASVLNLPALNPSSLPQTPFSTSTDAPWLTVEPPSGLTPRLIRIQADPTELPPGEHNGLVTVAMPLAQPIERRLAVRFSVGPPTAPQLSLDTETLSFTYPAAAEARTEAFLVSNDGGGELQFQATAETDSGGPWLSAQPAQSTALPASAVSVEVRANPLPAGTYTGRIRLQSNGGSAEIPVTMTISAQDQAILLTQRGLSFTAVEQGGPVPPQTFGVTNLGRGPMSWTLTTCTLTAFPCDWLEATPTAGISDPAETVPQVNVSVNQAGLAPGAYYGLVEVHANQAPNSPHVLTVFLEVLPAGADPGAALTNNQLIFTSLAGGPSPSSQETFVYNVSAEPKSFRGSRTLDSGNLEILPGDGVLDPDNPTRLIVQPFVEENTPPGEYPGAVTLQFSDGRTREIGIRSIVSPSAASLKSQSLCAPSKLVPVLRSLPDNFSVSGGSPVGLQVEVADDCGRPQTQGSVVVEFSNGDPQISMTPLGDGRWDGTWQTNPRTLSEVEISIGATLPAANLRGAVSVRGGLRAIQQAPVVPQAGVVGAAVPISHQPLAPGSLITLFGAALSDGTTAADRLPLPQVLQSTSLFLAGRPMPLLFTSDGQVNAMVPYAVAANTNHQIVIQRGPTLSRPVAVNLAPSQPAIFRPIPTESQGHIYIAAEGRQTLADAQNPATAGDILVIYCAGLGEVAPPIEAGLPAPVSPLSHTVNEVRVTIGGRPAPVQFAGLAPGFSGLYQVNAAAPSDLLPGEAIPITLQVAGQLSQPTTMAWR